ISRVLAFAVLFAIGAVVTPARAQTNWTGINSIGWFDPGNWDAGVPTPAITANIDTITPNATVIAAPADAQNLFVGNSGTGMLPIQTGGLTLASNLFVGNSGTGTLTIQNGTVDTAGNGLIGFNSGSTGTVTVTGPGSTWTMLGNLTVADSGTGTLAIQTGGAGAGPCGGIGV